jgi:hypothetical protein
MADLDPKGEGDKSMPENLAVGPSSVSPLTFGWDAVDRSRQSSFPCHEDVSWRSRCCRRWCSAPMSVSG